MLTLDLGEGRAVCPLPPPPFGNGVGKQQGFPVGTSLCTLSEDRPPPPRRGCPAPGLWAPASGGLQSQEARPRALFAPGGGRGGADGAGGQAGGAGSPPTPDGGAEENEATTAAAAGLATMGSKFPGCFPRGRRWRRSSKTRQQDPPAGGASDEPETPAARTRSTPSTSSDAEAESGRAYFSSKARVSLRHQLDSERDATT